ncbi:MAG: DMT family transporter [Anaerolineales bacterium]|nr:DMT family transporter [Anaerolineales bacterium]
MKTLRALSTTQKAILGVSSTVFAAAYTPILIRYAQGEHLPSLTIIMLRLWMISLAMTPFILPKHRPTFQKLSKKEWLWVGLAGPLHALNLTLLFFSLQYTTVLINVVLRQTSPLWTLIFEGMMLHAAFSRKIWGGALITVFGTTLVGLGNLHAGMGSAPWLGAGLALINAITNSVYLLVGRKMRHTLPFLPYSWAVFFGATLTTTFIVVVTHTPVWGFSSLGYLWVFLIAIISQVFGHIPINGILRLMPASMTSISLQLSVVFAAIFAFIFLKELPSGWQMAGSGLILVGVVMATGKSS